MAEVVAWKSRITPGSEAGGVAEREPSSNPASSAGKSCVIDRPINVGNTCASG